MVKDFALVLSGGGAKGAYELGVWKALKEFGIDENIGAVSGTSVGSLNGVLFAQNDYEIATEIWNNLSQDDIAPINTDIIKNVLIPILKSDTATTAAKKIIKIIIDNVTNKDDVKANLNIPYKDNAFVNEYLSLYNGAINTSKLEHIIKEFVDYNKLIQSNINFYLCATLLEKVNLSQKQLMLTPFYIQKMLIRDNNELIKYLMASSAIFPVFNHITINNQIYIDGGFTDNTPIKPLYEKGYRKFIIVYLSKSKFVKLKKIFYKTDIILEIQPTKDFKDEITSIINFSPERIQEYIKQGYNDALKVLEENKNILK